MAEDNNKDHTNSVVGDAKENVDDKDPSTINVNSNDDPAKEVKMPTKVSMYIRTRHGFGSKDSRQNFTWGIVNLCQILCHTSHYFCFRLSLDGCLHQ